MLINDLVEAASQRTKTATWSRQLTREATTPELRLGHTTCETRCRSFSSLVCKPFRLNQFITHLQKAQTTITAPLKSRTAIALWITSRSPTFGQSRRTTRQFSSSALKKSTSMKRAGGQLRAHHHPHRSVISTLKLSALSALSAMSQVHGSSSKVGCV